MTPLNLAQGEQFLVDLAAAHETERAIEIATEALTFLSVQVDLAIDGAEAYPRGEASLSAVSSELWFQGTHLTKVCDRLADALGRLKFPKAEAEARRMAASLACRFMPYPDQVFPRVLRHGKCLEVLNQLPEATGRYEAILGDFEDLGLRSLLPAEVSLDDLDVTILESVQTATQRLIALQAESSDRLRELHVELQSRLQLEVAH